MSFVGGNKDEFVTSLAAMALFDGDAEVSGDQINTLITATGNSVEAYWPSLFASLLTPDLVKVIYSRGGGSAPAGGGGGDSGGATEDAPEAKVEKPKEEEVDALAGGMDMFGGEGGSDY
eukprot:CAMPEP_0114434042 /NCGR_PEP_ID=MMETSP0103-20121206/12031_1 /TAXON_ID=37642 ORGANISM="Paraphysomonas imperforata, Strain PA2" /NCGR_SAMPLE_ID=MMETSP0103 /ASSEMBLY_ACC=CAM_ASM_000201 /LENGTH=118 /DNA_ID=CAMNT_0001603865 /DNA_START=39 /DNA_END=395 /DNA_ORIENTATION=-